MLDDLVQEYPVNSRAAQRSLQKRLTPRGKSRATTSASAFRSAYYRPDQGQS